MTRPRFLITIDTEGDNLWARSERIETRNAHFLPRFQALCEKYDLKPTWLTNYEMACCPEFVAFGRDVQARGTGEIGMHLHAWNSPPIVPLTEDDNQHHPYLIEYPLPVLQAKIEYLTDLLEDTFGTKMISHRAGRWAFDGAYARALIDHGYRVDCSVTPHVSWQRNKGAPFGDGGTDYRSCPEQPYHLDPDEPRRSGTSALLEVPVTIKRRRDGPSRWLQAQFDQGSLVWRLANRVRPLIAWLRPNGRNRQAMLWVLDEVQKRGEVHAEFMLHSSELMPGGSPTFPDGASIERLFDDLEHLFAATRGRFQGATLGEFHAWTTGEAGPRERLEAAGVAAP
jgi:hypothetical protein